jgi:glycine C-acetyltransferase
MTPLFDGWVADQLSALASEGLMKPERVLGSAQGSRVSWNGRELINLCANNYLGLASDPRVVEASIEATRKWGAGLASVRFICGTLEIHKELEHAIADYLGFEDAILFAAAFDANGGLFEPLLGESDAIVSDALNHASIIDGVRLSKARRYRFASSEMNDLERALREARSDGARHIMVATDGVFSMDGAIANLEAICDLAERHDALVMVDDCHATGVLGEQGRGTPAYRGVEGRVDIVTGTFGKTLGGAMGGFIAARSPIVELLRQRARPYLFSNALPAGVCGGALAAVAVAKGEEGAERRARLASHAAVFRAALSRSGFDLLPGEHPIVPIMLHDARKAQRMATTLLDAGVLASGFFFPVVPHGQARIRTQMSAALTDDDLAQAAATFARVGKQLELIP